MRINIIIILIYFTTTSTVSYSQTTFSKYYDNTISGSRVEDQGKDFIILPDSGYLFPTFSANIYEVDTLGFAKTYLQIIRTNLNGDTIFRKLYRKKNFSISVTLIEPLDNNKYLLAGYIFDLVKYDKDSTGAEVLLVKINGNGDTLWTKTVGIGDGDELVTRLVKTRDGGFAIFGQSCDKKETNCDFYLMKVDSNGNKLWNQTYSLNSTSWEMPESFVETNDGGFLLGGYTADEYKPYLVKTDSTGNKEWFKSYPKFNGFLYRIITDVTISQNNTYLITGVADKSTGERIGFFSRINSSGSILLDRQVGNPSSNTSIQTIIEKDDIIYLQGETKEYLPPQSNYFHTCLYAFSSIGTPLWRRTYPDSLLQNRRYLIYRMKTTPDNGFAMIGFGRNPITPDSLSSQDVWLLKVDSNGCLYQPCLDMTVGIEANKWNNSTIKLYPNPTYGIIRIETEEEIEQASIYNLLGQIVFRDTSIIDKKININHLDQGIYIIKIRTTAGLEFSERLIKQ